MAGQLIVNVPVLSIMLGAGLLGYVLARDWTIAFLFGGIVLAWVWWSFTVPRWRRWALRRGAPAERLQRLGVMTGLLWPKGWLPEKTEFNVRE